MGSRGAAVDAPLREMPSLRTLRPRRFVSLAAIPSRCPAASRGAAVDAPLREMPSLRTLRPRRFVSLAAIPSRCPPASGSGCTAEGDAEMGSDTEPVYEERHPELDP